jgi:tRNA(fMet)-specific endonuclease VapC
LGYLLDTSVAVLLREGEPWATTRLRALDRDAFLSAITRVELESGIYAKPDLTERRRAAVRAMLTSLPVLDFDFEMAEAYGAILASTGFSRRKITDRMIAATALVEGLALITVNGEDFRDVPGLELVVWEAG